MKISGPLVSKIDKDIVAELLPIAVRLANKDTNIWGASELAPQILVSLLASLTAIGSRSATIFLSILATSGPDIFT